MNEYLNRVGQIREQQISLTEDEARRQSSLGESLGLWVDDPADGEMDTMEARLLRMPPLRRMLTWMDDWGLMVAPLTKDRSTVVPEALQDYQELLMVEPDTIQTAWDQIVRVTPEIFQATYQHPQVNAALMERATLIAAQQGFDPPKNLGQAVIVWNVTELVFGAGSVFSLEWMLQRLSEEFYLNNENQPTPSYEL